MRLLSILALFLALACGRRESRGRSYQSPNRAARGRGTAGFDLDVEDRHLIGSTHPPFPLGYVRREGMMLDNPGGVEFGMTHLQRGAIHLFLLDSMTPRDAAGKPQWVTLAALAVPPFDSLKEGVATVDCFLDQHPEASIVALGRWSTTGPHVQDLVDLRFAARPDVLSRRFELLPLDRVTCWVDEDRS